MMPPIRRVIQYSGLDFHGALDLPCDLFLLMLKNSIIEDLQRSKEGQEYLEKCERLNKTELDVAAFRQKAQSRKE